MIIIKKQHFLSRSELLIGENSIDALKISKVIVLGIGGVGSYVVEGLVRSGIGNLTLVDDDAVCLTNLNRQVMATHSTISKNKVDVMKERVIDIFPTCNVTTHNTFITKENIPDIIPLDTDYVVDAIDTITSKLDIIEFCKKNNIEVISCMGTGNKLDPTAFKIADISKTKVCPLAKVMRHELKKRRIKKVKVLYSEEIPTKPAYADVVTCKTGCICVGGSKKCAIKRQIPGSMSFVPSVAGFIIAGEVIKTLIHINN